MIAAIVDFERLTHGYIEMLRTEGIGLDDEISPAAVIADLCHLAGVPVPEMVAAYLGGEEHIHEWGGEAACTVCGCTRFG